MHLFLHTAALSLQNNDTLSKIYTRGNTDIEITKCNAMLCIYQQFGTDEANYILKVLHVKNDREICSGIYRIMFDTLMAN